MPPRRPSRPTPSRTGPSLPAAAPVRIERIGVEADGIARLPDGAPAYVPFTLPGETVLARPVARRGEGWQAEAEAIEITSPDRVAPPCPHFTRCGGCGLQHWRDAPYRDWKASLLARALTHAGFAPPDPLPFIPGLPGERRRLDFAARRVGSQLLVGLHAPRSAEVIDLSDCLVLHPDLMALIPPLRGLLATLGAVRREASVIVNRLDAGPDLLLRTDAPLTVADRTALSAFAARHGMPRISHAVGNGAPETAALLRPPVTTLSGIDVRPPPGAFLQATAEGERAIVEAVRNGLPRKLTGRSRIAELYAGCGTLTFALAPLVRVTAFEGDAAAFAALKTAANQAGLTGRMEPVQRDLVRQPLSPKELGAFAAIVLDPPHAGAAAQIPLIAASGVGTVIYVSCNPATLSRDATALRAAGYGLAAATAIDQFLWSARLESVCVFRK